VAPRPVPHPGLQAPIERETHTVLRAATLELVETESRRRFPTTLHAGVPGRTVRHVDDPPVGDAGLRADVVLSLLRHATTTVPRPFLWLTRPGELSPHDDDLRWLGPASWACAGLGAPLGLVVVTRRGWFDPVSGVRREWRRLRPRPA
jgi:hypothetical protein